MFKKVVVSISGGIDSAVTALLLKSKGFNVTAVFMKNWDIANEVGECQAEKDFEDAKWVCDRLQIPIQNVNFVKDYWNDVFSYLLENYENGKTPNPDIQCNKTIKFNKFFHYARHELGADAIATGHYARSSFGPFLEYYHPDKNAALLQSKDSFKDQTFFLSQISQTSLRRTMFPLGEYLKKDVRKIAKEANLDILVRKKESTGICFIGKREFKDFIVEYIEDNPGDFVNIQTGQSIGKHSGYHKWTIGQRCRIGGESTSYFIFRKDVHSNTIYVVAGSSHPALFSEFLVTSNVHWINEEPEQLKNSKGVFECHFRFQHIKPLESCTIYKTSKNNVLIRLHKPQRAITTGQYAVLYKNEECLGSAEILYPGPSYYFLNKKIHDYSEKSTKEIVQVSQR